jgi:hypothetical protein
MDMRMAREDAARDQKSSGDIFVSESRAKRGVDASDRLADCPRDGLLARRAATRSRRRRVFSEALEFHRAGHFRVLLFRIGVLTIERDRRAIVDSAH